MARVVALTDPDTALGFRLAGIETLVLKQGEEIVPYLEELLEQKQTGVVILNEDHLKAVPERLQRRMETSLKPVFVSIPHVRSWREGEKTEEYLIRLLRRVIGYQIKIRR
jgi:V/A-type H+-transporting ATPase subunit F